MNNELKLVNCIIDCTYHRQNMGPLRWLVGSRRRLQRGRWPTPAKRTSCRRQIMKKNRRKNETKDAASERPAHEDVIGGGRPLINGRTRASRRCYTRNTRRRSWFRPGLPHAGRSQLRSCRYDGLFLYFLGSIKSKYLQMTVCAKPEPFQKASGPINVETRKTED